MGKKNKEKKAPEAAETEVVDEVVEEVPEETEPAPKEDELDALKKQLAEEHDQYLRVLAEYDNFRKRSRKEKEGLYVDVKAETVQKFLPVFDDLERALANETTDEDY